MKITIELGSLFNRKASFTSTFGQKIHSIDIICFKVNSKEILGDIRGHMVRCLDQPRENSGFRVGSDDLRLMRLASFLFYGGVVGEPTPHVLSRRDLAGSGSVVGAMASCKGRPVKVCPFHRLEH